MPRPIRSNVTYISINSNVLKSYILFKEGSVDRLARHLDCSPCPIYKALRNGKAPLELVLAISDELATPPDMFSTVHRDGNKITFERIESE